MSGHARGARNFRIDTAPFVEVDSASPELTRWSAYATPVNASGKPLKSKVRLVGYAFPRLVYGSDDDYNPAYPHDRVLREVERFEREKYERANPPHSQVPSDNG